MLALATLLALPGAIAIVLGLQAWMGQVAFDSQPAANAVAWCLAVTTLLSASGAFYLQSRLQARSNAGGTIATFAIAASVVQLPALLCTLSLLFGAPTPPVWLSLLVVSVVIVALYRRAMRSL